MYIEKHNIMFSQMKVYLLLQNVKLFWTLVKWAKEDYQPLWIHGKLIWKTMHILVGCLFDFLLFFIVLFGILKRYLWWDQHTIQNIFRWYGITKRRHFISMTMKRTFNYEFDFNFKWKLPPVCFFSCYFLISLLFAILLALSWYLWPQSERVCSTVAGEHYCNEMEIHRNRIMAQPFYAWSAIDLRSRFHWK